MRLLARRHNTTPDAAKAALEAEFARQGCAKYITWNGFEGSARVGFGALLKASGRITDDEIVIDTCNGALGSRVLGAAEQSIDRLFAPAAQKVAPAPAEEAKPEGERPTVDQMVNKFSLDDWKQIEHLSDGELVEYLFRVGNKAFLHIIQQVPDERIINLRPQLDALIAGAAKPGWLHRQMNHSNAKREQLIREAVAERHALKNKSRRRLVMTIVLACLVVIGVVIYLVV